MATQKPEQSSSGIDRAISSVEEVDGHAESHDLSASPSRSPCTRHWSRRSCLFDWTWECLCWMLGVAALGAMAGTIAQARDQSAAAWRQRHANLSINAIVAVLSAVVKGTSMLVVAEGQCEADRLSRISLMKYSDWRKQVALVQEVSQTSRLWSD